MNLCTPGNCICDAREYEGDTNCMGEVYCQRCRREHRPGDSCQTAVPLTSPRPPMRHGSACRWSGLLVGQHRRGHSVPLSDDHCVCDPYGDKARATALRRDRYERRHVLWQTEHWWDAGGTRHDLRDFDARRLAAILGFLERRARSLKSQYEAQLAFTVAGGEHAQDAVDALLDEVLEADPREWLRQTPLHQWLTKHVRKVSKRERRRALREDFQVEA